MLFIKSTRAGHVLYFTDNFCRRRQNSTLLPGYSRTWCSSVPPIHLNLLETACPHNLLLHQVSEVCLCKKIFFKTGFKPSSSTFILGIIRRELMNRLENMTQGFELESVGEKVSRSPQTAEPQLTLLQLVEDKWNVTCKGTRTLKKSVAQLWAGYERVRESR